MPDLPPVEVELCDAAPLSQIAQSLKTTFRRIDFTTSGIDDLLGPDYSHALYEGQPAALRYRLATLEPTPLVQAITAFILRDPLPEAHFRDLVGDKECEGLIDARAVTISAGHAQVHIDIRPHLVGPVKRWVFSDADASMKTHIPGPEHVLGVGAASLSLLDATPTSPTGSVLDVGTGSGIQVLGQAQAATRIVATDVHQRALDFAAATLAGEGIPVELRCGSWFEPVEGEKFDRIIANPPFVVGPPEIGHIYRDSGMDLDGATRLVVEQACAHLAPGGTAHLIGAWIHSDGESWQSRVASWLPDEGFSAWVVQRDVATPAQYVGTWLRDESLDLRSPEADERTRAWLNHFASAGVHGVGFGFIAIEKMIDDAAPTDVLAEELTQHFTDPLGPEVEEYFFRMRWLRDQTPESILASQFRVRPGVAREVVSVADHEESVGFADAVIRLTRTDGPRWSHDVDKHLSSIVSGLHPHGLCLAETVELYALAQDLEPEGLAESAVSAISDLIRHGVVLPEQLVVTEPTLTWITGEED